MAGLEAKDSRAGVVLSRARVFAIGLFDLPQARGSERPKIIAAFGLWFIVAGVL